MDLKDIQPAYQFVFMGFSDGDLAALEVDGIPPYIFNFSNIHDIGAVYFQEVLAY
jgi:hypothetical protein